MKRTTATVLAIGSILACAAVSADPVPSASNANQLSAKLTLASDKLAPATVDTVSSLQATYTISNPTNDNISYEQSGRTVIWSVVDSHGTVVADPDHGKMIPMFVMRRILRPGEHVDFPKTIPLVSVADGSPLPSGTYTVDAYLSHAPALKRSSTFTIK